MIPHLTTSFKEPLLELERKILDATPAIERWFRLKWQDHTPPFYCSVDLRNAGFKLAPVDTNLFPGGFNNLSQEMLPLAVQATIAAIEKYCPDAKDLMLIPEAHTRNPYYQQNIACLIQILRMAGLNVHIGALTEEGLQASSVGLQDGTVIMPEKLMRINNGRRIGSKDTNPCAVLLNNDLSSGNTALLEDLYEQSVLPPLHAGWTVRRKSNHFAAYDVIVRSFAKLMEMDPWIINPLFNKCGEVNFTTREGEEGLAENVHSLLQRIRRKYKEYRISEQPFVIVKADAGTYGMAIMSVKDASEIKGLNRKQRNKMSVVKDGLEVREVILQEGVYSFEQINNAVAEPVVYMIDRYVVGGFYRTHDKRSNTENLNAPGAHYVPLPFAQPHVLPDRNAEPGTAAPNRFYMYGVIARLALLAASVELEKTDPTEY